MRLPSLILSSALAHRPALIRSASIVMGDAGSSKRLKMTTESFPTGGFMEHLSPNERKTGKVISVCSKCNGEGKVRAPLSKKAKAMKKLQQEGNGSGDGPFQAHKPNYKPCKLCGGSGLLESEPSEGSAQDHQRKGSLHPDDFSVAICGGGIGGLALAIACQHRNIPCTVYERDNSFEERKQGYGLTMQQGARALRSLGFFSLTDEDVAKDGVEQRFGIHSTEHIVHKPDGEVVGRWGMKVWGGRFEKGGRKHSKRQNAHISRQGLRRMLVEMLRPDTIRWGHKFLQYEEKESRKLTLTFERRSGEQVTNHCSILVGADGIRSAVRGQKIGETTSPLRYLGCIVILGIVPSPLSHLTNGETVFQTADGVTRLYAMPFATNARDGEPLSAVDVGQQDSEQVSMWQLSFPMDEGDAKELSRRGPSALKAEAVRRCGGWHDPIPAMLERTHIELISGYPCYDRLIVDGEIFRKGPQDSRSSGGELCTLIGDGAHPMSPFKGQGANQALLDGVLLARKINGALRKNSGKVPDALAEFEEEMLQRSAVKVKKSAEAAVFLHSEVAIGGGNVTRGAVAATQSKG